MTRERLITGEPIASDDELLQFSLRPRALSDYVGQESLKEKLHVLLEAARRRKEPVEHVLLYGPPGLGKTTLAHIIAAEMQAKIVATSGPALQRAGDLMGILTNLNEGDILFIDEIHRLSPVIEEFIYPAMEDFKVDFVVDKGAFARTINLPLKRFTLIGATTRAGMITGALRDRFGLHYHLDFYPANELTRILLRSAALLQISLDDESADLIARRSRGTPRIANRLLRRVRDFASVKANGTITSRVSAVALDTEGIDAEGLDQLDRKMLEVIISYYQGGPVGVEALAATLNEEPDTLVDMVEPYLLKIGFLQRTRRGRIASAIAARHLGLHLPSDSSQQTLFS